MNLRFRDLGYRIGRYTPGKYNAITDCDIMGDTHAKKSAGGQGLARIDKGKARWHTP
jgi:hypothetical protein